MRWIISKRCIVGEGYPEIIKRALSSLAFETNGERGIMPAIWTDITMDSEPEVIWISPVGVAIRFQVLILTKELDKYLRKKGVV